MARQPKLKDEELPLNVQRMIVEADEIDEAFAELPEEDTKVAIYRMREQGRSAYIQSYTLSEFNVETLRERHGGGKFKIIASTKNKDKVERIIEIEGNPIVRTQYPRNPEGYYGKRDNAARPMPVDGLPIGDSNDPLFFLMHEIKEMRREMTKPHDSEMMKLLGQLIINNGNGTSDVEEKIFNRLIQLKSLFGGTEAKTDSNIIFQAMKTGMEMISNAEASSGSPWIALAEKGLPIIQNLLLQVAKVQAEKNGAIPMPPPSKPPLDNPVPISANQPTGFAAIAGQLQPYLPTFMQSAAMNSDPNILVELTISSIPEVQKPVVIEWLHSATWQQDLIGLNQGIALQLNWWQEYHDFLLENLTGKSTNNQEDL
jgi:hypothetical protein